MDFTYQPVERYRAIMALLFLSLIGLKTLWEKEQMLVTSIFSGISMWYRLINHKSICFRNSIEGDGRFRFTQTVTANSHPKRRSLSETYLEQAERIEIPVVHHQGETSDFQPKVPKLEIRSPVLGLTVTLPSNQGMDSGINPLTSLANNNDAPARRSTFSSHSRIPLSISKRSRSSETIHRSQGQGRSSSFRPTSPFSFSLTTPTSSLFSFKFLDNNNKEDRTKKFRFDSARESQC